ncbi:MAG: 23S rRNA (uracil(1939)-C(5))-methyltransferase RlmD [Clostridia bacterium]|nr:23S rRNA (uracil(1939)-C(5))-methyltransferase RlmD [Clostridia bacterium]
MRKCPVFSQCGGCDYCSVPYTEQLLCKEEKVKKLLKDICVTESIIGCDNPFNYRNKVHAAFSSSRRTGVKCGRYQAGTHKIVENFDCLIEDSVAQKIIKDVKEIAVKFKVPIYDEDRREGNLRKVLVRVAVKKQEYMLVLVVAKSEFPGKKNFLKEIRKIHPEITTIILNVNSRTDSMILGDKSFVEYGSGYITDELLNLKFRISDKSFYQINQAQTEKLYSKAIEFADIHENDRVLDAYCGIGTIGMTVAKSQPHARVTGVELNRSAVNDAIKNKKLNSLSNIDFICADATEYMMNSEAHSAKFDVVILDPPRAGTTPEFIRACKAVSPKRIVYVSCNPVTLANDLKLFIKAGYKPERAVPVDMFPLTEHVETVCLLSQLSEAPKMEMRVKLTEFDLTEAEAKATYSDIKEYVKEHTGLKVSSLYIAQVKQKYGIIERDCYNLPKSDDSRQPKCPEHKEKAIVEALKHFKMI